MANDINLEGSEDFLSPDESIDDGLLKLATMGAATAGVYMGAKAVPKQSLRHFANQSMNFLEGFYKPGITQWGKMGLYGKEAVKAAGRTIKMAANPYESIAYARTGVSPLIKSKIGSLKEELINVDMKFLQGDYGKISYHKKGKLKGTPNVKGGAIKKVRQLKNKLIKERHYKVLNDAANREIFDGKISPLLTEYRRRKPHLKNYWDYDKVGNQFRASAGNDDVAEYVVSRQKIGLPRNKKRLSMWLLGKDGKPLLNKYGQKIKNPTLNYIKWLDNSVSGVLRGAQFNYPTYEALNELKTKRMGKKQAFDYLEKKGFKPSTRGKKILFSFNPSIKSNFDWGGYNAVAEWNYAKKGHVTFHATDLRDTPISSLFKGNNVVNYVQAKDVEIKTIKKHTDMDTKPNFVEEEKYKKSQQRKLKPLTLIEEKTRADVYKSKLLEPGAQVKTIERELYTLKDKADKAKSRVKISNLLKAGAKEKNLLKYAKYARNFTTSGLLLAAATYLASQNKD